MPYRDDRGVRAVETSHGDRKAAMARGAKKDTESEVFGRSSEGSPRLLLRAPYQISPTL